MSAAIAGSEVAITVESMFSMNRATATISGTMRLESMGGRVPVILGWLLGGSLVVLGSLYSTRVPVAIGHGRRQPCRGCVQWAYPRPPSRAIDLRQPKTGHRFACEILWFQRRPAFNSVAGGPI